MNASYRFLSISEAAVRSSHETEHSINWKIEGCITNQRENLTDVFPNLPDKNYTSIKVKFPAREIPGNYKLSITSPFLKDIMNEGELTDGSTLDLNVENMDEEDGIEANILLGEGKSEITVKLSSENQDVEPELINIITDLAFFKKVVEADSTRLSAADDSDSPGNTTHKVVVHLV